MTKHESDLFSKIYDEISDAMDLLDNVTAASGSEDDLGCAELALTRAREVMIASPTPRLIAEAPAMLAALRQVVALAELHIAERSATPDEEEDLLACAYLVNARAILARIDGEGAAPTAQLAGVWRIVSGEPDTPRTLYWSNANGWGGIAGSDAYSDAERARLSLPIGGAWWFDADEYGAA